ncbi:hypothetical protein AVEN_228374-1 [Araneus ventricosus]|uniref:Uncharacterized protein n=1 Tax=Araneus ventricosus TaxID=182803 RepID=A0A4Y2LHP3_ARAVE|nr:hypothetical protein AVEN_228374-1 [Araneus ventricosus]
MDIHGRTVPHQLECVSPDSSSFRPIHLGGSFMEAPRKRSLRSPRATAPTPFKMGSPPRCPERASLPLLDLVVFAFVRRARPPLPRPHFSLMA